MAQFFYARSGAGGIVAITSDPTSLTAQFPGDTKLYVVCTSLQKLRRGKEYGRLLPGARFISPRSLTASFLTDKLVVHDSSSQKSLHTLRNKYDAKALKQALICITFSSENIQIATRGPGFKKDHTLRGKSRLLPSSTQKECYVVLQGKLIDAHAGTPLVSVLAIMHIFNERDIIRQTIKHLLSQGVDIHIIDNWSTDGTYEIIQALAEELGRITYERYPSRDNGKFELGKMLNRVTEVAKSKKGYKWIMLNDADEFRWSPWPSLTLQEAITFVDGMGYNAVDYTVFNFIPLGESFKEGDNPVTFFKYGEFSGIPGHFVQVKSWLNNTASDLASSGGHHVTFPEQRIFPLKFLLAHYPFRSLKHAKHKIFKERKVRYSSAERAKGWHTQYDDFENDIIAALKEQKLIAFNRTDFYENYLLERLSGVGIKRKDVTH